MIENYEFGSITINGNTYNRDVIIHGEEVLNGEWWREEGHLMQVVDFGDLPDSFEVIILGRGHDGVCQVPQETLDFLKKRGEVIVQMTTEATQTYNKLLSEGKNVVGAFHLTC